MVKFNNEWDAILKDEFSKEYYLNLRKTLINEYNTQKIFPNMNDIFNAMKLTSFSDVKAVIIGQDPYHGEGQAHGLSFSVKKGTPPPPSLVNIFKEIKEDVGIDNLGGHGELTNWAKNGVLLLNTVLTVRANTAKSHQGIGWETFTDNIIKVLDAREKPIVFMLWGRDAKSKASLINNPNHYILTAVHPSPLSAYGGFFGCKHFSKANEFLKENNISQVDWSVE